MKVLFTEVQPDLKEPRVVGQRVGEGEKELVSPVESWKHKRGAADC